MTDRGGAPIGGRREYPDVKRVLRPGGRILVVTRTKPDGGPAVGTLQQAVAAVFRASRILDNRQGWAFVEALKPGVGATPAS
jgi:hypothetical protein